MVIFGIFVDVRRYFHDLNIETGLDFGRKIQLVRLFQTDLGSGCDLMVDPSNWCQKNVPSTILSFWTFQAEKSSFWS